MTVVPSSPANQLLSKQGVTASGFGAVFFRAPTVALESPTNDSSWKNRGSGTRLTSPLPAVITRNHRLKTLERNPL